MNKKQLIITLVILIHFPVIAHARIIYSRGHHNDKPGEFASPTDVFNFKLGITNEDEFVTQNLFPRRSGFKNINSGQFRSTTGIFKQQGNEFSSTGLIFDSTQDEFSSGGLIPETGQSGPEKESFKSPEQARFKFYLPKEKK
jgi:hypothetical protein